MAESEDYCCRWHGDGAYTVSSSNSISAMLKCQSVMSLTWSGSWKSIKFGFKPDVNSFFCCKKN